MSAQHEPNGSTSLRRHLGFMTSPNASQPDAPRDNPAARPLIVFASIAIPVGWVLLTAYQLLDLPAEPFVLATLLIGLLVPAIVLTRRDPTTDGRQLWRDCYKRPRPLLVLVPAIVAIPGLTALVAHASGVGRSMTASLLLSLAINIVSSVLIINLWEELVWTGFFQRRVMTRWGLIGGSVVTAVLFAGIHLPLAFDGASSSSDVAANIGYLLLAGIGLRLLIAGFDVWSSRSLLTVGLLHASFNAAAGVVHADHDFIRYLVTLALGVLVLATPARHAYGTPTDSSASNKELEHDH